MFYSFAFSLSLSFLSISMYSAENEDKSRRTSNVFSYQFCAERRQMSFHSTAHLLLIVLMIIVKQGIGNSLDCH